MGRLSFLFATPRRLAEELAAATALGAFMGLIGPFGSYYGAGLELRIVYWTLNLWIGYAVLSIAARLSLAGAARLDVPSWFALAIGTALGAVPLCLAIRALSIEIWPPSRHIAGPFFVIYGECLAMAEPLTFGYALLLGGGVLPRPAAKGPKEAQGRPPPEGPGGAAEAPFLARLRPGLGADLLCLTMEDHYVRAHTLKGSDLLLMPLKDALEELGALEGLQVHRSAWVARAAVEAPVWNGRSLSLRLRNGLLVPVSRAQVARLKAAGWL
jgi:hypothetical protein